MNPMSIMAQAEKLGIPELQRSIQDGVVPAFIGVPLLQEKVKKAKQMQMGMAAQQPKRPSVAEQVGQEAQQATIADIMKAQALRMQGEMGQTGGISDSLPKPEGYAKGGPIAFAARGLVPNASLYENDLDIDEATALRALSPDQLNYYSTLPNGKEAAISTGRRILQQTAPQRYRNVLPAEDITTDKTANVPYFRSEAPVKTPYASDMPEMQALTKRILGKQEPDTKKSINYIGANDLPVGDITSLPKAPSIATAQPLDTPRMTLEDYVDTKGATLAPQLRSTLDNLRGQAVSQPAPNIKDLVAQARAKPFGESNLPMLEGYGNSLMPVAIDRRVPVSQPTTENILNKNAPNRQTPDVDQTQAMQNRIAAGKAPPVMGGNAPAVTRTPYAQAAVPATQTPATETTSQEARQTLDDYMKQYRDVTGENKGIAALQSRLAERESRLAKEEDRAPWMALMQAGLATMAGTSPNAMANIGQGGVAGLQAYTHSMNKLEDAKDKSFDIQAKLEEAQRAEQLAAANYGLSSVKADKAADRTEKLEQKKLDAQMDVAKLKDATDRLQIAASTANAANSLGMRQKELEGSENYLRTQYANLYDKAQNETDPNKKAQLENQLKGLERSISLGSSRANQTLTPSTVLNSYDERIKGLLTQLSNPALSSKDRLALQEELNAYKKASTDIMKQHGYGIDVGAGLPVGGANQTNNIQSQATEIARKRGLIK